MNYKIKKNTIIFLFFLTLFFFSGCSKYFDYNQNGNVRVSYKPKEIDSFCGNNIKEFGESCSNCPEDVRCLENETCCYGRCEKINCYVDSDCEDEKAFSINYCFSKGTCDSKCYFNYSEEFIDEIVVIYEEEEKRYFSYDEGYFDFKEVNFLSDFYKEHEDIYDFLIVAPQKEKLSSSYHYKVNSLVENIGFPIYNDSNYKFLKSLNFLSFYNSYKANLNNKNKNRYSELILSIVFHEVGHQWCCYLEGLGNFEYALPGHWTNNLDLFSGNEKNIDIMSTNQWIKKDDEMICNDINFVSRGFSNLTMYLAGFISKDEVGPLYLHRFQSYNNSSRDTWGPSCYDDVNFTKTEIITIEDIIQKNGERIPSYKTSQKDFYFKYVIVVPYGDTLNTDFLEYINIYLTQTPQLWSEYTNNKSTARIR
ncbi:MAG: hypothetical protein PHT94_02045 [Candidatus Nanoarchaeia archaeon]|nr:hypothetical protein [Candidatus Nanoarchaeia archaeon]